MHTVAAALGLGALLRTSQWPYRGLQLGGALYLASLGVQLLRAPQQQTLAMAGAALKRPAQLFLDGALSNISNPKIALFYLAVAVRAPRRACPERYELIAAVPAERRPNSPNRVVRGP